MVSTISLQSKALEHRQLVEDGRKIEKTLGNIFRGPQIIFRVIGHPHEVLTILASSAKHLTHGR